MSASDGNVRAEFAGRFNQSQCEQIGCDGYYGTGGVGLFDETGVIVNGAIRVGILNQRTENFFIKLEGGKVAHNHFDAQRFRAGFHYVDVLRVAILGNEKDVPSIFQRVTHGHCFGGGGFIEQ